MMDKTNITLRQGLEKFYKEHKSHLSHHKEGIPCEVKNFFRSHDIAHVLFGCDISLFGEGAVKIWTIFGTTLGFWKHIRAYQKANAFELSRNFSLSHVLRNIFRFLLSIPALVIRAKKMTKPLPWTNFEPHLDTSISELRKEYNIRVLS
ncbi:Coq4 family protein [Muriicola sp.]|uniref:Coq4 family protein n=1 Tax=Muriicola sp. TaxID=2020856 RepID=UPI003C70FF8D